MTSPTTVMTDDEWKEKLTSEQYAVLRLKKTEEKGTYKKILHNIPQNISTVKTLGVEDEKNTNDGIYSCVGCDMPLFEEVSKINHDYDWPAFDRFIITSIPSVIEQKDYDGERDEVICAGCHGHLGHVFRGEGHTSTNIRYCINSCVLNFILPNQIITNDDDDDGYMPDQRNEHQKKYDDNMCHLIKAVYEEILNSDGKTNVDFDDDPNVDHDETKITERINLTSSPPIFGSINNPPANITEFLKRGYDLNTKARSRCSCSFPCTTSLMDWTTNPAQLTPRMIDFMINCGLLKNDDMTFVEKCFSNFYRKKRINVIIHLCNITDKKQLVSFRDKENGVSLLHQIMYTPCEMYLDLPWFMDLLNFFKAIEFDMTCKTNNGQSLLNLAIRGYNTEQIDFFLANGCQFSYDKYIWEQFNEKNHNNAVLNMVHRCYAPKIPWSRRKNDSDEEDTKENEEEKLPSPKYQKNVFDTVTHCIGKGYDVNSTDWKNRSIKDYVFKYIKRDKFPEYHEKYYNLLK